MTDIIKDSSRTHWVNRAPKVIRPYLQLSRLDRPVGYWLLALPGWMGIAFAGLSRGLAGSDVTLALLILIGAIAMRGVGCTYNDIVDQDLDAQVERTALRPLPAGTVTTKQAWIWLFAQCGVGLIVLLCLPRLAQIIALCSIPLVAAYPFMKRITWFPQVWLGMTFNWAVLVAYAAKTGEVTPALGLLYVGLIFWTVGYDTIYACQDIEDDGLVGIKSTARRFGSRVKLGVGVCYGIFYTLTWTAICQLPFRGTFSDNVPTANIFGEESYYQPAWTTGILLVPAGLHLMWQVWMIRQDDSDRALWIFKSNIFLGLLLFATLLWIAYAGTFFYILEHDTK